MIKDKSALSDPERRYAFRQAVGRGNVADHRPRASGDRFGTPTSSRGSVHLLCWAHSLPFIQLFRDRPQNISLLLRIGRDLSEVKRPSSVNSRLSPISCLSPEGSYDHLRFISGCGCNDDMKASSIK